MGQRAPLTRTSSRIGVVGGFKPALGQVKPAVQERVAFGAGVTKEDARLAIGGFAQHPTILMGHAHRGRSFLGEFARVQALDPVWVVEDSGAQLPVPLAQPGLVPVKEPPQPGFDHIDLHLLAVAVLHEATLPLGKAARPANRLPIGRPIAGPAEALPVHKALRQPHRHPLASTTDAGRTLWCRGGGQKPVQDDSVSKSSFLDGQ